MANTLKITALVAGLAALAACGETPIERTATGAVGGAALAQVLGEDVAAGALIGGAAGGLGTCAVNPNARGCF